MNAPGPPSNFLDKSTLFSLILIFAGWFLWEKHIQNKYSNPSKTAPVQETKVFKHNSFQQDAVKKREKKDLKKTAVKEPRSFSFKDDKWSVVFSSQGLGVKNARLKQFFDRQSQPVNFQPAQNHLLFEIRKDDNPVLFNMKKSESNLWQGTADMGGKQIKARVSINDYFIHYKIFVQKGRLPPFQIHTVKTPTKGGASGFIQGLLFGEEPPLSLFAQSSKEEKRVLYNPDGADEEFILQQTQIMGLGGRYFGEAFLNLSDVLPDLNFQGASNFWAARLNFNFSDLRNLSEVQYKLFFGPKSTEILKTAGEELVSWVDFGFLSFLAQIILAFLKLAYSLTENWGASIILLTLLVRLILLPLNLSAYQSMKVMKKIQPEMQALRAKYKEEPKRMNQEVLALMKKNKAQPLGGCLPMLLQFPVFFALYRVLAESFELYQAPFIWWIEDLSSKDPFYILPLLMGVSMYIQQKITPSNMDPAQQKILKLLPFIFTLFMINLPSGLTLYIFISTVFGLVQQHYFLQFNDESASKSKKKQ